MLRYLGLLTCLLLALVALTGIETRNAPSEIDSFAPLLPVIQHNALETNEVDQDDPPPHTEYAKMARYLVHKAEWVSMGSLSTLESIKGYPMVNIIAVADSAKGAKSTGVLYFYLTMLDFTAQDLSKENRLTVLLSMDQTLDCSKRGIDPMEPTCPRIMISGRAVKLENGTQEFNFGKAAMFSRHPAAKHWLETHNFFLCKLDIAQIAVLDYYGGPHFVTLKDYMNANLDSTIEQNTDYEIIPQLDDERIITVRIKKDSNVRRIHLEV